MNNTDDRRTQSRMPGASRRLKNMGGIHKSQDKEEMHNYYYGHNIRLSTAMSLTPKKGEMR